MADSSDYETKTLDARDDESPSRIDSEKQEQQEQQQKQAEPPNGGLLAWLQVLASFFLFFNTWGFVNTFGVYQNYYDGTLGRSPSDVSWIGTFQAFLLLFVSALAGPLFDKGYLRYLLALGSFLIVFGVMMTSLSTQYYQAFLAQGVVVGLGSGLLQIPSLAFAAHYFTTKRALAIGTAAAGGSVGALLYPIVFRKLLIQVSFGWATRVIGFIALATLIVSNVVMKSRAPPAKTARSLIDVAALRDPQFIFITLSLFFYFMGIYTPFFYITSWAQLHLKMDEETLFYLLPILNAGSIFGRVIPGLIADKLGALNMLIAMTFITGILNFVWISLDQFPNTVVFCIFYGFFSGAGVSLPANVIVSIIPEPSKVGTWMGMSLSLAGLGLLIGNPIVGQIIVSSGGSDYLGAQCFSGAVVILGGACLCVLRWLKLRRGVTWSQRA